MNIQEAIKKRDNLKVDIGVMEGRRSTILHNLKERFGTDDIKALNEIRAAKEAELGAANARRASIEADLDALFAGV